MTTPIRVRAVKGIVFPRAAPRTGFVGYDEVDVGDEDADHVVAGSRRYRLAADDELVPNTAYYRRAVQQGDIERVEPKQQEHDKPPSEREDEPREALHTEYEAEQP